MIESASQPGEPCWVLGLNIGRHDSSAALVADGKLVAMAEQERFSRRKRAIGEPPHDAIRFCLAAGRIGLADVRAVALGSDMDALDRWHACTAEEMAGREKLDDPERLFPRAAFQVSSLPPLIPVPHHTAHAASAFWPSGYTDAAVLVVDNRGEHSSTTLYHATGDNLLLLEEYGVPDSLGLYYRTAAQYAGLYREFGEVGKFMGLASYGRPRQLVPLEGTDEGLAFSRLAALPPLRGIEIPPYRTRQLLDYFSANCYPYAFGSGEETFAYADFAASVQSSLEQALLGLCRRLRTTTRCENLVVAGGVGLNCSANGVIADSGLFKRVFVQPAAHDAGVALGAALEVCQKIAPTRFRPTSMDHAYWGPEPTEEEIRQAVSDGSVRAECLDEESLVDRVARLIADHKIVGWFQGRAEVGPRALGARSLLGNPTRRQTLVRLNTIKRREMWRPLAPSVPVEHFADFFSSSHRSPFMLVASPVHRDRQALIPAVVHADGSARPQAVARETNERYWKLLQRFGELSGIPILVNTSFNLENEPIVNTPRDAIADFLAADIDAVAIGDFLIERLG